MFGRSEKDFASFNIKVMNEATNVVADTFQVQGDRFKGLDYAFAKVLDESLPKMSEQIHATDRLLNNMDMSFKAFQNEFDKISSRPRK